MHITVLKENLAKALSIVGRSVSVRPQLPVLSNVLLTAKQGEVRLSATNLELGIIANLQAKIESEGEIAVPGKLLQEFVSTITADKLDLILDGTNLLVKSGKSKASFTTVSPADFPPFPEVPDVKKKLPVDKIKEAIQRAVFSASNDETRPVLTGIKTTILSGIMSLSATDGYRLSIERVDLAGVSDMQAILPASSLSEVIRIASDVKAEEIGFAVIEGKNQVVFILPDVYVFSRLIDGEFPNIEKIIPQTFKTRVVVDTSHFAQSVKTASLFARGAANVVKIKIESDGLKLSANAPQVGQNEDMVEAKIEGEENEIAFNYRFLLDLLNHFPGKEIAMEISGPLNPAMFKPVAASPQYIHIIMPVRVQT